MTTINPMEPASWEQLVPGNWYRVFVEPDPDDVEMDHIDFTAELLAIEPANLSGLEVNPALVEYFQRATGTGRWSNGVALGPLENFNYEEAPPSLSDPIVYWHVTSLYSFGETPARPLLMITLADKTVQVSADEGEQMGGLLLGAAAQARANAALVTHFRRINVPEESIAATIHQVNTITQEPPADEFVEADPEAADDR